MKYILKITVFLWIFFAVLGCGEESSFFNIPDNKVSVSLEKSTLNRKNNSLELELFFENNYSQNIGVSLSNLNIDVESCSIKEMELTPKKIEFKDNIQKVNFYANIQLNKKCKPLSFSLNGDTKLSLLGGSVNHIDYKSQKMNIYLEEESNNSITIRDTNKSIDSTYSFYNVPKEITISKSNHTYSFKVQVIDGEEKAVSGQMVSILAYDISYGTLSSMNAISDSNGFVTFLFTSAESLTELIGKTLPLKLLLEYGNTKKYETVKFKFKESSSDFNSTYSLINPSNLIIDRVSKEYTLSIDLVDSNGVGISNKEIKIITPNYKYGSVLSSTSMTNSSGRAIFKYISPVNLKNIDKKSINISLIFVENNISISESLTLTFNFNSLETERNIYKLINIKDVVVERESTEEVISVDLVDNKGVGVAGKKISISTPDIRFGSIKNSTSITDESGKATFIYLSPKDISSLDGKSSSINLTFIEDAIIIKKAIKITVLKKSNIDYHLVNSNDLIVELPKVKYEISVDLVDNENNPVSGKYIKLSTLNKKFGSIVNSVVETNPSGRAIFTYISADDLNSIDKKSTELKFTFKEDGVTISKVVKITISKKSTSDYNLINTTDIWVDSPSTEYQLIAYLVDSRGVAVGGKEIEITMPNSSKFGAINSSIEKTDIATGRVSFTYISPDSIESIDGESTSLSFIFTENDIEIKKTINLNFQKGIVDNTLPIVVIPKDLKEIILTNNSQTVDIPIKVFKDISPYSEGYVHIQLPDKVLDGIDVGSFSSFSVPISEDGIAMIHYTGPSNLKSLVALDELSSTFKIYHSENGSSENQESLFMRYNPSEDDYIPINYNLSVVTENSDFSMGLPNVEKLFSVVLKDSSGNTINSNDINITSIEVTTENSLLIQFFDSNSSSLVDSLFLEKKNNSPFLVKSKTLSGLAPIKVSMTFEDINNKVQSLSTIINVRVLSGPPSAISISYLSSSQDSIHAKYEEKFVVSVTDEYSNRINTKPYISLGAVIGYAVDGKEVTSKESNNTRRLFYGKKEIDSGIADGIIDDLADDNIHKTTFSDSNVLNSNVFKYVNLEGVNSDKLLVFGRGKRYDAMGKWDFDKIDNSTLNLQDDYFGATQGELSYAVGHNYYQDQCLDDGREWIGTTDSETYQLDDEGSVVISYKYDYQLMGKDASIWVNLNGYQPSGNKKIRIGEVIKHTLRGTGLKSLPSNGYSLDKNTTASATFEIWQENTTEAYRNAHFGWSITDGSNCQILSIQSSNPYDARTCNNGYSNQGRSYITFKLKAPEDKDCNFNISRILVAPEF